MTLKLDFFEEHRKDGFRVVGHGCDFAVCP